MSDSERLDQVVATVKDLRSRSVEHPQVFGGPVDLSPSDLVEVAARAAAMREFMGEQLSRGRKQLALAETMAAAMAHDLEVATDQVLVDQAQMLIARGHAWPERKAKANLSVLEDKVSHRGVEMRVAQVRSLVREMEDCYQAWRDTEWALDRQVRLLQLRHALGEV